MKPVILPSVKRSLAAVGAFLLVLPALPTLAGGGIDGVVASVRFALDSPGGEYLFFAPSDPTRLQVKVEVDTGFTFTAGGVSAQYRHVVRLLDAANTPVLLRAEDGSAASSLAMAPFPVTAAGTFPATLSVALADGVRLSPYTTYRLEVGLQWFSSGTWVNEGGPGDSPARRFLHFRNRLSEDPARNVITDIQSVRWTRTCAVNTAAGEDGWLAAEVKFEVFRYDAFAVPPADTEITVRFAVVVGAGGSGELTPAEVDGPGESVLTTSHTSGSPGLPWRSGPLTRLVRFRPRAQLPSVTEANFKAVVTIAHEEVPAPASLLVEGNTDDSDPTRVLHFNGRLAWGHVITTLTDLGNNPADDAVWEPGGIRTRVKVNGLALPDASIAPFPADGEVQVVLFDSGEARVWMGTAQCTLPTTYRERAGIRYFLPPPLQLGTNGADGNVTIQLPAGMGVGEPGQVFRSRLTTHANGFNERLEPKGTNVFAIPAGERIALDTRPLFFDTRALAWRAEAGHLAFSPVGVDYVRREAFAWLDSLQAMTFLPELQRIKPSNERYYQFVAGAGPSVDVHVNAAGRTALTADLSLGAGQFLSHFPLEVNLAWGSGRLSLQEDVAVAAVSGVDPTERIVVNYEQGCPEGDCEGQTARAVCETPQLHFTPDSGLVGEGTGPATAHGTNIIAWGLNPARGVMAHGVGPFQSAAFAMSGHVLLGGVLPPLDLANGPAVMLASGASLEMVDGVLQIRMFRPGTPEYALGAGHYAGLNVALAAEPDPNSIRGSARLGDASAAVPFTPSARAKYYVRRSGVSGLHEATDDGFPSEALLIYRYPFEFRRFALTFLSNLNIQSGTRCEIQVPLPVGERFYLDELTFTCVGAPDRALIAEGHDRLGFAYWTADLDGRGIEFSPLDPFLADCDASQRRFLGLGAVVHASGVLESLAGTLYLSPFGQIITPADTDRPASVSFYLGAGSVVSVAGALEGARPKELYPLILAKAYFNDERGDPPPGRGWLNFFGHVMLPFYGATPVHLTTLARRDDLESLYYFNGGWTEDRIPAWEPLGDLTHRGKPPGADTTWRSYRESRQLDHLPFAKGDFLDVINLSFPIQWTATTREFMGLEPVEHDNLLLIQTSRELKRLSASDIQIDLGATHEGIPRVRLTSKELRLTGPGGAQWNLAEVMATELGETLTAEMRNGFAAVRSLAGERMSGQLRILAGTLVAEVLPVLREKLRAACPEGGGCDPVLLRSGVQEAMIEMRLGAGRLRRMEAVLEEGLRRDLISTLTAAESNLKWLYDPEVGWLRREIAGPHVRIAKMAKRFIDLVTLDRTLDYPALEPYVSSFDAEMGRMAALLGRLAARVAQLKSRYGSETGDLYLELHELFANPIAVTEMTTLLGRLEEDLIREATASPRWVAEHVTSVAGEEDALKRWLESELGNRLVMSELNHHVGQVMNYHLRSIEEDGVGALGDALALFQRMMDAAGRQVLHAATQAFNNEIVEPWDKIMGFGNAEGSVLFSHDEVRKLRLNGKGGVDLGKEFKFEAGVKFEINALDSEGERSCGNPHEVKATECLLEFSVDQSSDRTVYAPSDPSLDEFSEGPEELEHVRDNMAFSIHLKASFEPDHDLAGLGGGFTWSPDRTFGAVKIKRVAGACLFGAHENYLGGSFDGGMGPGGEVEVQGALFLGRTCTRAPIVQVNSRASALLSGPDRPFTGFYVYAEGWIPIVSLTCMLKLSGGMGVGLLADFESDRYGGQMMLGVKGDLLCVLSVTGDVALAAVGTDDGGYYDGAGQLGLKLGSCPFCVGLTKGFHFTYRPGTQSFEVTP